MAVGESSVQLLHARASPFCMRVQLALALKGVEYETVVQDLDNKSRELVEGNPVYKKVPVLIHDGRAVCESGIILQYVDEAWPCRPAALLPSDPFARATALFWADFVDKKVFDALFLSLWTKGHDQQVTIQNATSALATFEDALKEPPFFGGSSPGFVDIVFAPLLPWLPAFEKFGNFTFPFEKHPRLQEWFSAFKEHPIASVLPQPPMIIDAVSRLLLKKQAEKNQQQQ